MENKKVNISQKKRLIQVVAAFFILLAVLIGRIGWIQFYHGKDYTHQVIEQQTSDNEVKPKRGIIYDRNYTVLASNLTVETVTIDPATIQKNKTPSIGDIAHNMAQILEIDEDTVLKKMNMKNTQYAYIKKQVEKDSADKLRAYVVKNKVEGVQFTESTKRYYPYNNFASQVIGFVGGDNQGLEGIEMVYDNELKGVAGRVMSAGKKGGLELPNNYDNYVAAREGNSVVLTIDETIQHYVEKHLENARIENHLEEGAAAIVLDVKTGEILAMATQPDYDLNKPFEITDAVEEKYPGIKAEVAKLDGNDYNNKVTQATQFLRRNKAVVDSYEPGSTFKIAVAAMALEENAVKLDDHFYCSGKIHVLDRNISCANKNGHGSETFVQGVQNSCNPVFIQVGQRVGRKTFMKYVKGLGFTEKTGIELPGETSGIFHAESAFSEMDLATASFGQSFTVTPLQMVTMVGAVANGGKMMKPHIVKQIVDPDKNVIKDIEPTFVRQVISPETSKTECKILESVVSQGGGKNAYLAGYRIAGKTGTSEKQPRGNGKYIASFVGIAPADDPQVVCLVILDQPPVGSTYYGGVIAAPVVKNILEETLQYLGIEPEYTKDEKAVADVTIPSVMGKTRAEATEMLKSLDITLSFRGSEDLIKDQVPKPFSKLARGSKIVAYTGGDTPTKSVTVPNVVNCTASEANKAITDTGLNVRVKGLSTNIGYAICSMQSPTAGTMVEPGTIITLDFAYSGLND